MSALTNIATNDGQQQLQLTTSTTQSEVQIIRSPLKSPPRQKSPRSGTRRVQQQKEKKMIEDENYSIAWHTLPISEVFRLLETNPTIGITEIEVLHRQINVFGKNIMTPPSKISFIERYAFLFQYSTVHLVVS